VIVLKTKAEIEKMRAAGKIVGQTLKMLRKMVAPGVKTAVLDAAAEAFIRKQGAVPTFKGYHGFPAALCISVNEEVVHGFPSGRRLKEGDILSIDCGATLNGYIGDSAVTICVGHCDPAVTALVETTEKALYAAIAAANPGNRLGDISHAVEKVARASNYGIVREYCGHGVGRDLHEGPQVPNFGKPGTGPLIRPGWTIAIEPMLNLGGDAVKVLDDGWTVVTSDGRPSAHFEHSIAVTDKGADILTLP
jgi:methionyl aminopeptidase